MLCFSCLRTGLLACTTLGVLWLPTGVSLAYASDTGGTHRLINIVDHAIQSNPEILAARAAVDAAQSRLAGSVLPLNNPELELEGERTDIDSYRLGINQTLDWHDKQDALQQVAETRVAAARQRLQALELTKTAELLASIGEIVGQRQIRQLASERTESLARFAQLAERRHRAGDIPLAELELARLSLAEARMQQARSAAALVEAERAFLALSGLPLPEDVALPDRHEAGKPPGDDTAIASNHPAVKSAQASARIARTEIRATDQGRKADPILGLAAGREGRENLIGLSLSIPLQLRNDFRHEVAAAEAESLRAEQEAQQVFRDTMARLQTARQRYRLIADAWSVWASQGKASLQQHLALLEHLWQTGELSSADYLLQIQQSLNTRITATEFQGERWRAWVDWLSASAGLDDWLRNTAMER